MSTNFSGPSENINVQSLTPAGTVLADATQISVGTPALIVAAGDGTAGIKLPRASKGKILYVKNTGGGNLKVWPHDSGDQINAISAGSSLSMATVTSAVFVAADTTHWYTVPLLPS